MTFSLRMPAFLGAVTLALMGGCTSSQPAPTTSTLTGTIAQSSFASPVQKITVTNDKGQSSTVAVDASGKFSATLTKGATYQLFLGDDGKSMPIVLNSEKGLVTTAHIKSGGASVDIGSVRFWPGDQSTRLSLVTGLDASVNASCVNGVFAGTSKPCASGAAAAQCQDEDDDEDGDHQDGEHQDGPDQSDANQGDGEQADGPSNAILAKTSEAVGIPERNITGDVGCDEGDDDDGEGSDGEGD